MANPDEFIRIGSTLFRVEEEGAWISFDLQHERIHLGQIFSAGSYTASLSNNGTITLSFTAGAKQPHMLFLASVGGNSLMRLYEGGSISGGAALTAYNRNRASSNAPGGAVNYGGTVTGGSLLYSVYIPGGSGPQKAGGMFRADSEWIGKINTVYNLDIINISGNSSAVTVDVEWYEVSES